MLTIIGIIIGLVILALLFTTDLGLGILGLGIIAGILYAIYTYLGLDILLYCIGAVIGVVVIYKLLQTKIVQYLLVATLIGGVGYFFRDDYPLTFEESVINFVWILLSMLSINYFIKLLNHKYILIFLYPSSFILGLLSIFISLRYFDSIDLLIFIIAYTDSLLFSISNLFKYKLLKNEYKNLHFTSEYVRLSMILFDLISLLILCTLLFHPNGFKSLLETAVFVIIALISFRKYIIKSPQFIHSNIETYILDHGRVNFEELSQNLERSLASKIKPTKNDIVDFLELLIENNKIISVENNFYNICLYKDIINKLLNKNEFISVEQLYNHINDVKFKDTDHRLSPLADKIAEQVALLSLPIDLKCGFNENHALLITKENNPKYIVCDYCGILTLDNIDHLHCSYECKNAANEEKEYFSTAINHAKKQVITKQSILEEINITENAFNTEISDKFIKNYVSLTTPLATQIVDKDHMMVTPQGHGFAAEEANTLIDTLQGKDANVVGYDNAKSGADRLVNKTYIQTKYYKTASQSINAGFENDVYKYVKQNGKPMQLEVPADQYPKAVNLMKKRIEKGHVPGIKDPRYAHKLVRKGHLTYAQSRAVATAGTIESITFDFTEGAVNSISPAGITGITRLANSLWAGKPIITSVKEASQEMVIVYGQDIVRTVIAKQVTKTVVGQELRKQTGIIVTKASEVILPKTLSTTLGSIAKQNIVTGSISVAFMSVNDLNQLFDGNLSKREFAGNVISHATQVGAAVVGGEVIGGALGTLIPIPGAGTLIGATIGAFVGNAIGSIFRTNVEEKKQREQERIVEENQQIQAFMPLFNELVSKWATVYILNESELKSFIEDLQPDLRNNLLNLARDYRNKVTQTTIFIRKSMYKIVAKRNIVVLEDTEILEIGISTIANTNR